MAATVQRATRKDRARVLIVDDHPIMRQGIAQIVHQSGGLDVCGEADCPEKAMQSPGAALASGSEKGAAGASSLAAQ